MTDDKINGFFIGQLPAAVLERTPTEAEAERFRVLFRRGLGYPMKDPQKSEAPPVTYYPITADKRSTSALEYLQAIVPYLITLLPGKSFTPETTPRWAATMRRPNRRPTDGSEPRELDPAQTFQGDTAIGAVLTLIETRIQRGDWRIAFTPLNVTPSNPDGDAWGVIKVGGE